MSEHTTDEILDGDWNVISGDDNIGEQVAQKLHDAIAKELKSSGCYHKIPDHLKQTALMKIRDLVEAVLVDGMTDLAVRRHPRVQGHFKSMNAKDTGVTTITVEVPHDQPALRRMVNHMGKTGVFALVDPKKFYAPELRLKQMGMSQGDLVDTAGLEE